MDDEYNYHEIYDRYTELCLTTSYLHALLSLERSVRLRRMWRRLEKQMKDLRTQALKLYEEPDEELGARILFQIYEEMHQAMDEYEKIVPFFIERVGWPQPCCGKK